MAFRYRVYDGRTDSYPGCQERFVVYKTNPYTSGVVPLWSASSLEELELRASADGTDGMFEREIWCRTDESLMGLLGTWGPSGRLLPFGAPAEVYY